jgi:hypothetical protein
MSEDNSERSPICSFVQDSLHKVSSTVLYAAEDYSNYVLLLCSFRLFVLMLVNWTHSAALFKNLHLLSVTSHQLLYIFTRLNLLQLSRLDTSGASFYASPRFSRVSRPVKLCGCQNCCAYSIPFFEHQINNKPLQKHQ